MHKSVIVVGMGELGSVLAKGCLKLGYSVTPVTRHNSLGNYVGHLEPQAIIIAVGEADVHDIMTQVPDQWKSRVVLIQNELLPRDWQAHAFDNPTIISVWFEKKKGKTSQVVLPSPVYGPQAELIVQALAQLNLPAYIVASAEELEYELVKKNLYILSTNIAGLEVGGTVAELAKNHGDLLIAVANDVLDIQDWLTHRQQDRNRLMQGLAQAFDGDPQHQCMGRSAPARLRRALGFASEAGLSVPTLQAIASKHLD
jgi:hypothetical protein